jgi:hypothetical protein
MIGKAKNGKPRLVKHGDLLDIGYPQPGAQFLNQWASKISEILEAFLGILSREVGVTFGILSTGYHFP